MKMFAVRFFWLMLSSALFAQDTIPSGTILPVQLNHSVRTDKAKPGQEIGACVMQDVRRQVERFGLARRLSGKWSPSKRPPSETARRFRYDSTS